MCGDGELLLQQDYARFIQNRVVHVRRVRFLGRVVLFVQRVAVEVGASVDGDGILGHVEDQESALVEAVVERTADGIAAQEIHGVDGVFAADGDVEAARGEGGDAYAG